MADSWEDEPDVQGWEQEPDVASAPAPKMPAMDVGRPISPEERSKIAAVSESLPESKPEMGRAEAAFRKLGEGVTMGLLPQIAAGQVAANRAQYGRGEDRTTSPEEMAGIVKELRRKQEVAGKEYPVQSGIVSAAGGAIPALAIGAAAPALASIAPALRPIVAAAPRVLPAVASGAIPGFVGGFGSTEKFSEGEGDLENLKEAGGAGLVGGTVGGVMGAAGAKLPLTTGAAATGLGTAGLLGAKIPYVSETPEQLASTLAGVVPGLAGGFAHNMSNLRSGQASRANAAVESYLAKPIRNATKTQEALLSKRQKSDVSAKQQALNDIRKAVAKEEAARRSGSAAVGAEARKQLELVPVARDVLARPEGLDVETIAKYEALQNQQQKLAEMAMEGAVDPVERARAMAKSNWDPKIEAARVAAEEAKAGHAPVLAEKITQELPKLTPEQKAKISADVSAEQRAFLLAEAVRQKAQRPGLPTRAMGRLPVIKDLTGTAPEHGFEGRTVEGKLRKAAEAADMAQTYPEKAATWNKGFEATAPLSAGSREAAIIQQYLLEQRRKEKK